MPRELRDLGTTVSLRPARRRGIVPLVAVLLLLAAVAARAGDTDERPLAAGPGVAGPAVAAGPVTPAIEPSEAAPQAVLPVLGRVGNLLVHVPAVTPVLVSYHEASFAEAMPLTALGTLSGNDNPTRALRSEPHPDGLDFHVQVSRGRANAPTSAVDVVLAPGTAVLAPVAGTVTEVRPYLLYGTHEDVRIEIQPDGSELAVVLIHVEDVAVAAGDRVEVGDVLAGAARQFPFGAVVDRQTEPDRYGHVHLEVKAPDAAASD